MDARTTPQPRRELIAVMRSRADAERVAARLTRMGLDQRAMRIDDQADYTAALRAEMRQELDDAVVAPQASFVATKEGARGFVFVTVIAMAVSALLALPLALIDFGSPYWVRYLVVFGILAVLAFTFGLVFGPSLGTKDSDDVAAATRGSVLRIRDDSAWVREVVMKGDPIRVDEVTAAGDPAATLYTESQDIDEHIGAKVKDTGSQVRHQFNRPR
jgi:hypothetical protein